MQTTTLKQINIKQGMPLVSEALGILKSEISSAKAQNYAVIKVIHGYGSTGTGGSIRVAVRKYLSSELGVRTVKEFIPGENFSIFDHMTLKAFLVCDELRNDPDLERHNNGVTFIIL